MKAAIYVFVTLLCVSATGCGSKESISQPESFAPPPDKASQKGDTAPGPP
jgi:hypothetical protein